MRILVCGGRDFNDHHMMDEAMSQLNFGHMGQHQHTIIHGAAMGADTLAGLWAMTLGHALEVYPADWKTHGKRAGYLRNVQMLEEGKPDLVVAFPGGKGTAMMIDLALKANVKVIQVTRDQHGDVHMGVLGPSSQTDAKPAFKTKKFEKIYLDELVALRSVVSSRDKAQLFDKVYKQEIDWLKNMDKEYNEIMQAQEAMDDARLSGNLEV